MILKSSQRANAASLADHLTNAHDNERVRVLSSRDLVRGDDVHLALAEMNAISKGTRCTQHLHHVMMNPDRDMTPDQWAQAWEAYEQEYGLEGQPFIEVEHHKEGRTHRHRVYDRITEQLKAVEFSNSYPRNEKIARVLEHEFGHELTIGKHNKAVMAQLRKDGLDHVVDWMEQGKAHEVARPVADKNHADHQIEKRTGLSKAEAEQSIRQAWDMSDSGHSLKTALEHDGLMLARGDKRGFVVVDSAGAPHALGRRVGEKAKTIKQRMVDLDPATLPSVEQARTQQLDLARQHEQAIEDHKRDQQADNDLKATHTPPTQQQAPDGPSDGLEKRKRKQDIQEKLDAHEQKLAADDRRKQRAEQRRLAAERAEALKRDLLEREQQGILTRARKAIGQKIDKVADWMRGLVKRDPIPKQQAQDKDIEAPKKAGDAVEIPHKSEQQRQADQTRRRKRLKRKIIDLEAMETEKPKPDKERDKQQEKDQGLGLERNRDNQSGGNTGGDDDPFKF